MLCLFCCQRNSCTWQNRWHHEEIELWGNIEAITQSIGQEDKLPHNKIFSDTNHTTKLVRKWLNENKFNVLERLLKSHDIKKYEKHKNLSVFQHLENIINFGSHITPECSMYCILHLKYWTFNNTFIKVPLLCVEI